MKFSLIEIFVSGYKYHDGPEILNDLISGEFESTVVLEKEPNNQYDKKAIKLLVENYTLGYVSKKQNELVNKWLDQDVTLQAQISEVDETAPDYQKIKIEIYLNL